MLDGFRQTQELQQTYAPPVDVNLVPGEAVTRRCRMRVMIVVPALAESQERDPPTVGRIIVGGEPASAPHVRSRVDQPCRVQVKDYAKEDAPHQDGPAAQGKEQQAAGC